jgi:hypothetical protein
VREAVVSVWRAQGKLAQQLQAAVIDAVTLQLQANRRVLNQLRERKFRLVHNTIPPVEKKIASTGDPINFDKTQGIPPHVPVMFEIVAITIPPSSS